MILWIVSTDWEAIADREPDELLPTVSSDIVSGKSNLKLENAKSGTPKRRGRGTFSYEKQELYSDQLLDRPVADVEQAETRCNSEDNRDVQSSKWHIMDFQSMMKKPVICVFLCHGNYFVYAMVFSVLVGFDCYLLPLHQIIIFPEFPYSFKM